MANVFCTKCGKQVPDNATSCPSCGHARTGIPISPARAPAQVPAAANVSVGHETPGFFKILLDASFSDFITLKLIKWLYILGCIVQGIGTFITVWEYTQSFVGRIAGVLILWPVLFIVSVVLLRVGLELLAAVFRIAENTTEMAADLNKP